MKPNTNEHKSITERAVYNDGYCNGYKLGSKQGYAKALDDVDRMFWKADELDFDSRYDKERYIIEQIAKLSHSQQVTDKQNRMLKSSSDASQKTADTHIPKESK